jgi:hypothetical protein
VSALATDEAMKTSAPLFAFFGADRLAEGRQFLQLVAVDIARLPNATVELVAALITVQHSLPSAFVDWMLGELGKKIDLSLISPAAHAAMQIGLASNTLNLGSDIQTAQREYVLIRALQKERNFQQAVGFLRLLSDRLEQSFSGR